jgi:hypothetical protein
MATTRPPATAMAVAVGLSGSMVRILALVTIMSACIQFPMLSRYIDLVDETGYFFVYIMQLQIAESTGIQTQPPFHRDSLGFR